MWLMMTSEKGWAHPGCGDQQKEQQSKEVGMICCRNAARGFGLFRCWRKSSIFFFITHGIFGGIFRRRMENKNIVFSHTEWCCVYFNRERPETEKVEWFWSFETKPKWMPSTLQSAFIDHFHFLSHWNSCWLGFQSKLKVLSLFLYFPCLTAQFQCRKESYKRFYYRIKAEILKVMRVCGTVQENREHKPAHTKSCGTANPGFSGEEKQARD